MQTGREGLALCGGGRYDDLIEQLGGPALPAAGFGLGLERILLELKNQGLEPAAPSVTDVYVANIGDERRPDAFRFTQELRARQIKADCDLCDRSLKAQFKYADKLGARLIVMVGGDEYERGNIRVRDLQNREEAEIAFGEAPERIRDMLQK